MTYEWRLWTPPSPCADELLRSNLSSPEYVADLKAKQSSFTNCITVRFVGAARGIGIEGKRAIKYENNTRLCVQFHSTSKL